MQEDQENLYESKHTRCIVIKVEHHEMSLGKQHEFLTAYFQIDGATNCLIVERSFKPLVQSCISLAYEFAAIGFSASRSAEDTITIYADSERLHITADIFELRSLTFTQRSSPSLTLLGFTTMAYATSKYAPNFELYVHQCWFADALFDGLHEKSGFRRPAEVRRQAV